MDKVYGIKLARKLVLYGIILFGIIELSVIYFLFPAYYTHNLLFIPVYFLLFGVCILLILNWMKNKKMHPGHCITLLMFFSLFQMMISFIVMCMYYYLIETHKFTMLFAFSAFYLFFMGIKLFIIYNIEIQHKIDKKNAQDAKKED